MKSDKLIHLLKLFFGLSIVYYLVDSGRINLFLFSDYSNQKFYLFLSLFIIALDSVFTSFRYREVLRIQSKAHFSLLSIMRLSWIGNFFSVILPGSASGDVVKLYYVHHQDRSLTKKKLLGGVLLDRAFGLFGMFHIASISALIFLASGQVLSGNALFLFYILFGFSILSIIAVACVFYLNQLCKWIPLLEKIRLLICDENELTMNRKYLVRAQLLSIFSQGLGALGFVVLLYPMIGGGEKLLLTMAIIPLGEIARSLPISPAGMGVSHFAYAQLFSLIGVEIGASVYNILFVMQLLINLMGVFPFIYSRNGKQSEQILTA